ncbi:MAG: oligosaccharide flippase family protein [Clostridiales bacterium]|nr:oligosaccharide flippase family protein [Clostridiales bacterium]
MNQALLRPDSAKKNFAFQMFYNVVILVMPLIISPYLTRTMGSTSLGIYTYTYSIAYYFVILAMLGINKHGQRIIAQRRNDIVRLRKTFWSLYCIHLIASAIAFIAYFVYVLLICKSDKMIAMVQAIYVFSAALDITWLFYGLEKFKMVALRNAFVKLLEAVCIFIFIKSPEDVGIYTLIMSVSICLGQIIMMPQVIAAIPPIGFSIENIKEHIKPLFALFAAVIAVTLYTVFDKTLLGILATKDDVAFYEYSDKIVKIPRTFVGVIGTVLFPRACRYAVEGDVKNLRKNFDYCLIVTSFIGFASAFGFAAVAQSFAVIYYGEAFSVCGKVMIGMAPLILIIGFGETVRQNYIYPLKKDATMAKILSVNAMTNLALSTILIPYMGIYGAVIGTIGAESVGLIAEFYLCRNYLSVKNFLSNTVPFAVIGLIMYAGVKVVSEFYNGSVASFIWQVVVGAVIYVALTIIYAYTSESLVKEVASDAINRIRKKARL